MNRTTARKRLAGLVAAAATTATMGVGAQMTGASVQVPGQTRDSRNAPVGAASITGVVSTEGGGAPVRRARVSLSGPELRGGRSTVTDDEGRFTFVALPAGRFTLTASKAGYVSASYGAKRAGRPGTPVQVVDGQKYERMNISLPRGSVITGIVVDDHGEPAPGTQVRVLRFVMRTGERALQLAGQDTTDDRGSYRVYGLQPGDYIVSAMPRNQGVGAIRETVMAEVEALIQQAQAMGVNTAQGGRGGNPVPLGAGRGRGQDLIERAATLQQQLNEGDAQTVAYAPVYYPGTATAGSALPVTLNIGEERAAIDFQLQLVQTARIEGTVQSYDGSLPQGVQISLQPADGGDTPRVPGVNNVSVRPNASGQFAIPNVTPGQYRLQARAMIRAAANPAALVVPGAAGRAGRGGRGAIAEVLWASVDLGVAGQNVSNVLLALRPGMKVSGRVSFQGAGSPPSDLSGTRITLVARGDEQMGGIPPALVDGSGQFTINGVPPGRYSITAGVPTGRGRGSDQPAAATPAVSWTLKSAVVNGHEALDVPMTVDPNQDVSGALLTFTDQTQEISGTIQDGTGNPAPDYTIVVYPVDQTYWGPYSRRIAATRPATDGRFTIRSLPAGHYRLTAVIDAEPGEWFNPDFLAQLVGGSIPITLAEGEKKVQDIRLAR